MESGGHGNRWSVFDEDVPAFANRWLERAIKEGQAVRWGVGDDSGQAGPVRAGEAHGVGFLIAPTA